MPSQDAKRAGLSRRNLLQGAATAGAAGLAVTAMGAAAPALAATGTDTDTDTDTDSPPAADQGHHADAGPIMVHVRDARSGDIEVFAGTSLTRLRDKDLAVRVAPGDRLTRRRPATVRPPGAARKLGAPIRLSQPRAAPETVRAPFQPVR